ncbi:MAG TPA: hypothetical protein VER96_01095 [Polyangiaceae bacterium]|nr:hypothetical protein [Polyangiaceae bacterium]
MESDLRDSFAVSSPAPSSKLLHAALAGILALSVTGCGGDDPKPAAGITSSKVVDPLDADGFKALCDARSGTVEVMPHCNGFATGPGFSYDVGTSAISEHTCAGTNTCGGWNCLTGAANQ